MSAAGWSQQQQPEPDGGVAARAESQVDVRAEHGQAAAAAPASTPAPAPALHQPLGGEHIFIILASSQISISYVEQKSINLMVLQWIDAIYYIVKMSHAGALTLAD